MIFNILKKRSIRMVCLEQYQLVEVVLAPHSEVHVELVEQRAQQAANDAQHGHWHQLYCRVVLMKSIGEEAIKRS